MWPSLVFCRKRKESCMEYVESLRWAYNLISKYVTTAKIRRYNQSLSLNRKIVLLPYDLEKRPAAWKYTIGVRCPHAAREKRTVPSKLQLGSVSGHELRAFWFLSLPEASEVCHKLIHCGWYKEKGCKGRCKCVKASLKCTSSLYKCGGNRERVEW